MNPADVDALVAAVLEGARYRHMDQALVRSLAEKELTKGRSFKEAVKAVRNKLHQVGGAFQEQTPPYARWLTELEDLSDDPADPQVRAFCLKAMQAHSSTRERLSILDRFYQETLTSLGKINSVLDLACGLNPLALSWMSLATGATYHAVDIYQDLADFLDHFFAHVHLNGQAGLCDLTTAVPPQPVQLALLLKTIPCLEQVDDQAGGRLLNSIPAEHILVTFPVHSLSGHSKGMRANYEMHFNDLIAGQSWHVQRFEFSSELAFLLSR
jgi:16S rRNA (guanine(1405)-N(7))-methyltransferase